MPLIETVTNVAKRLLGTTNEAVLRRVWPTVLEVAKLEPDMQLADDATLRARSKALRERVLGGAPLESVMVEAFALAREAADRRIGMWNALDPKRGFPEEAWGEARGAIETARAQLAAGTPPWDLDLPASAYAAVRRHAPHSVPPFRMRAHDVQVLGAVVLHQGKISEMRTGEGKTLVASLTCYLNALGGRGVHVITVNDYLAARDANWNAPTLRFLGVSVGAIQSNQPPHLRKAIYASDVTYGTNNEFGFDYLRDNLAKSSDEQVQTRRTFAVIDEVDSVLVDEARTPLIISGPAVGRMQHYKPADEVARQLVKDTDFEVDLKDRQITLSEAGIDKAAKLFGVANLYDGDAMQLPHYLDNALKAHHLYHRDKEYLVSQRAGEDHRRVHRAHHGGPALVRRPAPGDRGEGGRRDQGGEPDLRDHHPAELLPPLRQARRHDRHGDDRGQRVQRHLQARGGGHPAEQARPARRLRRPHLRQREGEVRGHRQGGRGPARDGPAGAGRHHLGRGLGAPVGAAQAPGRAARGAQRPPPRARGRDRRQGRAVRRGHHRHQHGRARHRHHPRRDQRGRGLQALAGARPDAEEAQARQQRRRDRRGHPRPVGDALPGRAGRRQAQEPAGRPRAEGDQRAPPPERLPAAADAQHLRRRRRRAPARRPAHHRHRAPREPAHRQPAARPLAAARATRARRASTCPSTTT